MNEYCRLKIIDACYKNKFCDWRLAHTLKSLSTWNRIYFVCVKKCHNKNRFRTAAAAAPVVASVANMTLYKNECTVEFGWCGVCQEYVIFWLELMSLCVCCFFYRFSASFLYLRIFVSFPTFSRSAIGVLLLFCVDLISISNAISPAMPLTIIIFFGVFFISSHKCQVKEYLNKVCKFLYMSFS